MAVGVADHAQLELEPFRVAVDALTPVLLALRAKREQPVVALRFFTSSTPVLASERGTYSPSPVSLRAAA